MAFIKSIDVVGDNVIGMYLYTRYNFLGRCDFTLRSVYGGLHDFLLLRMEIVKYFWLFFVLVLLFSKITLHLYRTNKQNHDMNHTEFILFMSVLGLAFYGILMLVCTILTDSKSAK